MIANTVAKRPRIPHGFAKQIVASLQPLEPVNIRKDYIGAIRSAANYLGLKVSINQRFVVGGEQYTLTLVGTKEAS